MHFAARDSNSFGIRLVADIYHTGATLFIEM